MIHTTASKKEVSQRWEIQFYLNLSHLLM
jgi:hypothetical protein